MAIKGLALRGLDFPQIGNIRKGDKAKNSKGIEYPIDLKYFRVEFDELETEAAAKFVEVYGDKPQQINILLPFDDITRCWDPWYEAYTAGRMVARSEGPGGDFVYLVDLATGAVVVHDGVDANGKAVAHHDVIGRAGKSEIKMKPVGRLKVLIPELQRAAFLVVHTTSIIDVANITSQLQAVAALHGGRIAGVPLVLKRRPKEVSVPKPDGSRSRVTKWMLSIEADPRWVAAKIAQMGRAALPAGTTDEIQKALTSGEGANVPEELTHDEDVFESDYEETDMGYDPSNDELGYDPAEYGSNEPYSREDYEREQAETLRYAPAELKQRIEEIAEKMTGKATPEKRGLVVVVLEQELGGVDPKLNMQAVTKYLTGVNSAADLTDKQVLALHKWLNPEKDSGGEWHSEAMAAREARQVLVEAMPKQEKLI